MAGGTIQTTNINLSPQSTIDTPEPTASPPANTSTKNQYMTGRDITFTENQIAQLQKERRELAYDLRHYQSGDYADKNGSRQATTQAQLDKVTNQLQSLREKLSNYKQNLGNKGYTEAKNTQPKNYNTGIVNQGNGSIPVPELLARQGYSDKDYNNMTIQQRNQAIRFYTNKNNNPLSTGVYGETGNAVIVAKGKPSTAGKIEAFKNFNVTYNPQAYAQQRDAQNREATRQANIGGANFQSKNGELLNITTIFSGKNSINPSLRAGITQEQFNNAVLSQKSLGSRIILNAVSRQESANKALNNFYGVKGSGYNDNPTSEFFRGIPLGVSKAFGVMIPSGAQMLGGEIILRGENILKGNISANVERNRRVVSTIPLFVTDFGKGVVTQVKTPSGLGELTGQVLSAKLIPAESKNIEVIKFKEIKYEQIGKYTDAQESGVSFAKQSIVGERTFQPYSKESFDALRAKEADYLVLGGNKQGVLVTNNGGFGVITDIDRQYLVKNYFKEKSKTAEVNTIKDNYIVSQSKNNKYAFPLSDVPSYPLRRPPSVEEVNVLNGVTKKNVGLKTFLSQEDVFSKNRDITQQIATQNAKSGNYVVGDIFFEKFTPTTNVLDTSVRKGADFFTERGVSRLPAPQLNGEVRIGDIQSDVYSLGNKEFIGRAVTTKETFSFKNQLGTDVRFSQLGNAKIATGFNRPRDIIQEKINPMNDIISQKKVLGNTRDDLSYYPVEFKLFGITTKRGYIGVMNEANARAVTKELVKKTVMDYNLKREVGITSNNGVRRTSGSFIEQSSHKNSLLFEQSPEVVTENPLYNLERVRGRPILQVNIIKSKSGFIVPPVVSSPPSYRSFNKPLSLSRNVIRSSSNTISRPISRTFSSRINISKSNNSLINNSVVESKSNTVSLSRAESIAQSSSITQSLSLNTISSPSQKIYPYPSLFVGSGIKKRHTKSLVVAPRPFAYTPTLSGLSFSGKPLFGAVKSGLLLRPVGGKS